MDTSLGHIELTENNINVHFSTIEELLEIIGNYDKDPMTGTIKINNKNEFFVFCMADKKDIIESITHGYIFSKEKDE